MVSFRDDVIKLVDEHNRLLKIENTRHTAAVQKIDDEYHAALELIERQCLAVNGSHVDDGGMFYVFRTDGVLWSVADHMFVHSGVDGYGEIDIAAGMDLLAVREKYPELVLVGGIECGELLTNGTPEAIHAEAKRVVEGLKPGARHILGSSNSVSHQVPPENYRAMLRAGREFGVYQ